MSPEGFYHVFLAAFGYPGPFPPLTSEKDVAAARATMTEGPPWEAEVPLDALVRAPFRTLVVSGAWDEAPPSARALGGAALHAVCDVLETRLGAQRLVFEGAGHNPHLLGQRFNDALRAFFRSSAR